jgi:hypothetical protein
MTSHVSVLGRVVQQELNISLKAASSEQNVLSLGE